MNHRFKLHPDGTLEITMPKGKKVSRVLVCEAGTQNGTLMYPDCDDCIKHGGDWECDHVHCHKGKDVPDTNVGNMISRQAAIDALNSERVEEDGIHYWRVERNKTIDAAVKIIQALPSAEPKIIRCKDCKHWVTGKTTKNYPNPYICKLHSFMHGFERSALPEDYCSWGELRGDSDE